MNYTYYGRYQRQKRKKRGSFASFLFLIVVMLVLIFIFKMLFNFMSSLSNDKRDDVLVSLEKGTGTVLTFGKSVWELAPDLSYIFEGDKVNSDADSYLALETYDGTKIRMDQNTYLDFDRAEHDENDNVTLHFVLSEGRIWFESDEGSAGQIVIHTPTMSVSGNSTYLLSNLEGYEAIHVFDGSAKIDYVEKLSDGTRNVLEAQSLRGGMKSVLVEEIKEALLAREAVILGATMEEDELYENLFVKWSLGIDTTIEAKNETDVETESESETSTELESEIESELESEIQSEEVVEPNLQIQITSPSNGTVDEDGAIAIEGIITNGTAERVVITWSGNGQPYALGLFQAGANSFRYVADANYGNFKAGSNIYTITAYDSNGVASNSVKIEIIGEF